MDISSNFMSINQHNDIFTTDQGVPFHLLRRQKASQPSSEIGSNSNQSAIHGLDDLLNKFNEKNIKDGLSNFLSHLPGYIDAPGTADDSLQSLIDKPPVGGRELIPLSESALQGFRLMPGSVPDSYKFMNKPPDKKKKKKQKYNDEETSDKGQLTDLNTEKKHKKRKKEEANTEKRKKEKKKKKKKDKKGEAEEN